MYSTLSAPFPGCKRTAASKGGFSHGGRGGDKNAKIEIGKTGGLFHHQSDGRGFLCRPVCIPVQNNSLLNSAPTMAKDKHTYIRIGSRSYRLAPVEIMLLMFLGKFVSMWRAVGRRDFFRAVTLRVHTPGSLSSTYMHSLGFGDLCFSRCGGLRRPRTRFARGSRVVSWSAGR